MECRPALRGPPPGLLVPPMPDAAWLDDLWVLTKHHWMFNPTAAEARVPRSASGVHIADCSFIRSNVPVDASEIRRQVTASHRLSFSKAQSKLRLKKPVNLLKARLRSQNLQDAFHPAWQKPSRHPPTCQWAGFWCIRLWLQGRAGASCERLANQRGVPGDGCKGTPDTGSRLFY